MYGPRTLRTVAVVKAMSLYKVYKYLLTALKFRRLEATYKDLIKATIKAARNEADFNYI